VSLRTRDVVHAFWIPDLRFKRDAWPRKTARFDLRFPMGTAAGIGHCAQYCGLKHSDMVFFVEAMDSARFATWSRGSGGRA
jgi:cytochrome c oxidase subunit II